MYRSNYRSLFRCHTLVECMNYSLDPSISKADLFLYLLDTYDILLSHADGSMIMDENDDTPYLRLSNKLELYVFEAWDSLLSNNSSGTPTRGNSSLLAHRGKYDFLK